MKTQIKLDEAIGKTIKIFFKSRMEEKILIAFQDETFVVIGLERYSYSDDYYITEKDFNYKDYSSEDIINAGFYTEKELAEKKEREMKKMKAIEEARQYNLYKNLKNKYESNDF